jgi:hypothetical protein
MAMPLASPLLDQSSAVVRTVYFAANKYGSKKDKGYNGTIKARHETLSESVSCRSVLG